MVSWDNLIRIVPRNNANQARTKSTDERVVDVFPSLMALYTRYLLEEYGELDSDYVFVNLWEGRIWSADGLRHRRGVLSAPAASDRHLCASACSATPTPPT
jgi:hypothetical protein